MYYILMDLVTMLVPVLSFTTEEIWRHTKKPTGAPTSVQMTDWPTARPHYKNTTLAKKWADFIELRGEITKVLETARQNKIIGHSLDARVVLYVDGLAYDVAAQFADQLANLLIVSQVRINKGLGGEGTVTGRADLKVLVEAAVGEKCERCWIYSPTVGDEERHPTVCARCAQVVE
jgi:isoleucyl-tRNA synthetase